MSRTHLLRGTLDLLILKALAGDRRHGYGVAEWIESATDEALLVEEGTLYPALHRLERKGLISGTWGVSDNNRRAKYYEMTRAGRAAMERELAQWSGYAEAMAKALRTGDGG